MKTKPECQELTNEEVQIERELEAAKRESLRLAFQYNIEHWLRTGEWKGKEWA